MSIKGTVTLRYSDKIMNFSAINDTAFYITVRDNYLSTGNKTILGWNVTQVRDREHEIQIYFAHPGDLS